MHTINQLTRVIRDLPRAVRIAILIGVLFRVGGFGVIQMSSVGGQIATLFNDGSYYVELAQNLKEGKGYGVMRPPGWIPERFRTPGIPLLLVPFVGSERGISIYQILLVLLAGALFPWLTWYVGRETTGPRAAIVAAWLIACEPLGVMLSWVPLSDIPASLSALISGATLVRALRTRSAMFATLSGLAAGVSYLIRPGNISWMFIGLTSLLGYSIFKKQLIDTKLIARALAVLFILPLFWASHLYFTTGTFTALGTGWSMIYGNFLPSVLSTEKGTTFIDEKNRLKDEAPRLGLGSRYDLNNPSHASIVRTAAIDELKKHPITILKIETLLLVSFFTNDGWYSYAMKFGLVPKIVGRSSPTNVILREGFNGIPKLLFETQRQLFIPLLGRLFTVSILALAVIGFLRWISPLRWAFAAMILSLALLSSVSGFGVEGRYRLAVAPLLYLLAGIGVERFWRPNLESEQLGSDSAASAP